VARCRFHTWAERSETAIEPRLDGGERGTREAGNFFEGHLLVESQNEDFSMQRLQSQQRVGDELAAFEGIEMVEGRLFLAGDLEGAIIVAVVAHFFEAGHGAAAAKIDDEVTRDGEEPGIEARLAVELGAAGEDTHPGFLEQVFGELAVAGEIEQIAQQAVLVLEDELVEDLRIVATEPLDDEVVFAMNLFRKLKGCRAHVNI